MNKSLDYDPCGIEVSARTLVVRRRRPGEADALREFANTAAGHQALLRWLEGAGRAVRVCLEATGLYGLDLALALEAAGVALMVANPRAVRHFAQAMMQRSKTDRLDAAGGAYIALYVCAPHTPQALRCPHLVLVLMAFGP